MIFPDGRLTIPSGPEYVDYGPFLEVVDFEGLIDRSDFDRAKHQRHSADWSRSSGTGFKKRTPPMGGALDVED
jgi:hypothetical protein